MIVWRNPKKNLEVLKTRFFVEILTRLIQQRPLAAGNHFGNSRANITSTAEVGGSVILEVWGSPSNLPSTYWLHIDRQVES